MPSSEVPTTFSCKVHDHPVSILSTVDEISAQEQENKRVIIREILTSSGVLLGAVALSSVPLCVVSLAYTAFVAKKIVRATQISRNHALLEAALFHQLNKKEDSSR